jgi:hypothetical protein
MNYRNLSVAPVDLVVTAATDQDRGRIHLHLLTEEISRQKQTCRFDRFFVAEGPRKKSIVLLDSMSLNNDSG